MFIVAIAWIYVVLLMAITESSVAAGIMTFLTYCALPLAIILYLMATPQRRRRRHAAENPPSSEAVRQRPEPKDRFGDSVVRGSGRDPT